MYELIAYQKISTFFYYTLFKSLDVNLWSSLRVSVRVMLINATFNIISFILWRSLLLVEKTGVPGENH